MTSHYRVAVIGAGFSGLGMAVNLRSAGIDDFVVVERAASVGGAWRDNTYPGAQCDVQSALYSFSFAPNPQWSRTFAVQQEIRDYLERVVIDHDLTPHLRLGTPLESAIWKDQDRRWELHTPDGPLTADILVNGTGTLSDPSIPDIPGMHRFGGTMFHSAQWDHSLDLAGKRVAVVGTGASAIQFVPAIQPKVEHLTVFQRTPVWVLPRHDKHIPNFERSLYEKFPVVQRLRRSIYYWSREAMVPGLSRFPQLIAPLQWMAKHHLRTQVTDPDLRATLTPEFALGCKRILISNEWYPALNQPNVDVVSDGIVEVTENGVITADGAEHEVDVIIFGTGFHATEPPIAHRITGRSGRTLAQKWNGSMHGHRCTTVAGFPNFFLLNGPNLGVGHTSMVYMIESQIAYVMDAIVGMESRDIDEVEVTPAAEKAFAAVLDQRTKGSVWTAGGCTSWYLDKNGHNTVLWPGQSFTFRRLTESFDWESYDVRSASASVAASA